MELPYVTSFCSSSFWACPSLWTGRSVFCLLLWDLGAAVPQWEGRKRQVQSEAGVQNSQSRTWCLRRASSVLVSHALSHAVTQSSISSAPSLPHPLTHFFFFFFWTLPQFWPQASLPSYILRPEAAGLHRSGCCPDQGDPAGRLLVTVWTDSEDTPWVSANLGTPKPLSGLWGPRKSSALLRVSIHMKAAP